MSAIIGSPTLRSFAAEVSHACQALALDVDHLDIAVSIGLWGLQVQVYDQDFGRVFTGAIRIGRAAADAPVFVAAEVETAIRSALGTAADCQNAEQRTLGVTFEEVN